MFAVIFRTTAGITLLKWYWFKRAGGARMTASESVNTSLTA
jgi:hypothetical protein